MRTHVCLLRGINVGGNRLVKMADLKAMLKDAGLTQVSTLLQSGNCSFRADGGTCEEWEAELEARALEKFGFAPTFFVRTVEQWNDLVRNNPFPQEAIHDPKHLVATLLRETPSQDAVEAVSAAILGPERIQVVEGCLYAIYPDGIGTSKVGSTPGWRKLFDAGTGRNWNTVLKLQRLLEASG